MKQCMGLPEFLGSPFLIYYLVCSGTNEYNRCKNIYKYWRYKMNTEVTIQLANPEDAKEILDIYAYYVENTAITYEYEVPSVEEFKQRIINVLKNYPYLVAKSQGKIVGYAYAGKYHPRAAYGWNAEMTVYLNHNYKGNGIGQKLYNKLEDILKAQGVVNAISLITAPNTKQDCSVYNSQHFHEKMGYKLAGKIEKSGYKFNKWFDTLTMVKMLGEPVENMQPVKTFEEVREQFGL